MSEIHNSAWDEIFEVFGDGTDYDWALDDDEAPQEEELIKGDLKFADVSGPLVFMYGSLTAFQGL